MNPFPSFTDQDISNLLAYIEQASDETQRVISCFAPAEYPEEKDIPLSYYLLLSTTHRILIVRNNCDNNSR